MDYEKLMEAAREAVKRAYAPYSSVHVGAAVLTSSGKVYAGCNVENVSYGATICAERVAAVKAVSDGERKFKAIAVASDLREITPCGICRQFLTEFSDDMDIVTEDKDGGIIVHKLTDYLPDAFVSSFLNQPPSGD